MVCPRVKSHLVFRIDPNLPRVSATSGPRLGRAARLILAASAVGLVGVLAMAARLRPDPRGYGTHEQLGLPRCAFSAMTGTPCPSCGMTTAFAWCARGRLDRAWRANPAGSVLAPTCAVLVVWMIVSAARGRPWITRTIDGPLIVVVSATVAIGLGAWMIRMILWRVLG